MDYDTQKLGNDISGRLKKLFPDMTLEQALKLAEESISIIEQQADEALYTGLVLYGVRMAKEKYETKKRD